MRVAYLVCDSGIPIGGTKGASVHVASLSAAMAEVGAQVTVFSPKVIEARIPGVEVVEIPVGPVPSGPAGESRRVEAAREFYARVSEYLECDEYDALIERLSLFADGGGLADRHGLRRVVEVNAPVATEREAHFGLIDKVAAHGAEKSALKGAVVVAVSDPLAAWALAQGAKSATVIANAADPSALDPARLAQVREELREAMGFSDLPVIGFVGSLKPWHGLEPLFSAVSRISESERFGLLIVGDGPGRDVVKAGISSLAPNITAVATGAVSYEDVPKYLASMDIAVAPYLPSENFYFSPLKVAEAMAAGKAVVASDFGSVRELLGDAGVLVPPGDAGVLGASLERLVVSPRLRNGYAERARSRALGRNDWKGVARRTLELAAPEKTWLHAEGAGIGTI